MGNDHANRCPSNVPGPFYTIGTCLACESPEYEAPDLLAPLKNGNYTTYFVKQPQTSAEIARVCSAIEVCCVCYLRYGVTDLAIIKRLGNDPQYCDYLLHNGHLVPTDHARAYEEEYRKQFLARRRWWKFWRR